MMSDIGLHIGGEKEEAITGARQHSRKAWETVEILLP